MVQCLLPGTLGIIRCTVTRPFGLHLGDQSELKSVLVSNDNGRSGALFSVLIRSGVTKD